MDKHLWKEDQDNFWRIEMRAAKYVDAVMELAQLNIGKFEIGKLTFWSQARHT